MCLLVPRIGLESHMQCLDPAYIGTNWAVLPAFKHTDGIKALVSLFHKLIPQSHAGKHSFLFLVVQNYHNGKTIDEA